MQDFLDQCQEAGRQVLEEKIEKLQSQAAGSLDLDTDQVDTVFASNCIETRIKTMQEKALLVNQQHQASQQQAVSGLQGALASAEVVITSSEAVQAADALAKQAIEEEVVCLLMRASSWMRCCRMCRILFVPVALRLCATNCPHIDSPWHLLFMLWVATGSSNQAAVWSEPAATLSCEALSSAQLWWHDVA